MLVNYVGEFGSGIRVDDILNHSLLKPPNVGKSVEAPDHRRGRHQISNPKP
jgi:hypothetical protein